MVTYDTNFYPELLTETLPLHRPPIKEERYSGEERKDECWETLLRERWNLGAAAA